MLHHSGTQFPTINGTTIFLPVAYHNHQDSTLVQLIGPPQTIIPVAISRRGALNGIQLKSLPLPLQLFPSAHHRSNKLSRAGDDEPLDLSVNATRAASSSSATSSSINSRHSSVSGVSERKRLLCECGVSFISCNNLKSHQRYYCKNKSDGETIVNVDDEVEVVKERKESITVSRKNNHRQHPHQLNSVFICLLCGYQGYSQRGIRIHLRITHAEVDGRCNKHFTQLVIPQV